MQQWGRSLLGSRDWTRTAITSSLQVAAFPPLGNVVLATMSETTPALTPHTSTALASSPVAHDGSVTAGFAKNSGRTG